MFTTIIDYFQDKKKLRFWRNISLIQNQEIKQTCKNLIKEHENALGVRVLTLFEDGVRQQVITSKQVKGNMVLFVAMIHGLLDGMLLYDDGVTDMKEFIGLAWDTYWDGLTR